MAEAKEAEPNERAAPSPRRPRRNHVINLCCAQSVHQVVEEVARSLERLGFRVGVVTGAEARAALLGSRTDSSQPTIHVVCVQGSMQERVLKPLRQALATHGGPNHHLFVAVLDLGVPLAMVGQIRRFAEALERAAPSDETEAGAAQRERTTQRELEALPTRSYPAVAQVPERSGTKPPSTDGVPDRPRRTRPLTSRGRAAKIVPTNKYQAVTASHAAVPKGGAGVRKRRRERSQQSPSAVRPSAPAPERVLGLPAQDSAHVGSGPVPQGELPAPPPPTGEQARHRSATTIPAVSSPAVSSPAPPHPPKVGAPTASSAKPSPTRGAPTTSPVTPPTRGAPTTSPVTPPPAAPPRPPLVAPPATTTSRATPTPPEPDQLQPRGDAGFRFTPPGVKAAEVRRPQSGPVTAVPLAEVLSDADRTLVQGVLQEVPRTASTLRLDDPPVQAGQAPRPPRIGPGARVSADDEPIEPTMLLPAPTGPREEPAPPRGETVVQRPPSATAPRVEPIERTRVEASPFAAEDRPDETMLYGQPPPAPAVSDSAKTLLRGDGGFETAGSVLRKAQAARATGPGPGSLDGPPTDEIPKSRPLIMLEPEDRGDSEPEAKPKKTVLYGDSVHAPMPGPPSPQPATARPKAPEPGPAASTPASAMPDAPSPAPTKAHAPPSETIEADAPRMEPIKRRRLPSAIPTERHSLPTDIPAEPHDARRRQPRPASSPSLPKSRPTQPEAARAASTTQTRGSRRAKASSSHGWLWVLLVLLTAGGGSGAYRAGLFDGLLGRDANSDAKLADASHSSAVEAKADDGSAASASPAATEDAVSTGGSEPAVATTSGSGSDEPAEADSASSSDPTPATDEPEPTEPEPTEPEPTEPEPTEPEPTAAGPKLTPDEQILAKAADRREIFMLRTLFTTRRQGSATTFAGGWQRCAALGVDGVKGWRLPHRREMKLINAVLPLPRGIYWTRTVPDDDKKAAYVLDSSNGALSLFLKQEPTGEVVCVRRRKYPDER